MLNTIIQGDAQLQVDHMDAPNGPLDHDIEVEPAGKGDVFEKYWGVKS
jgi:hypothetical protein